MQLIINLFPWPMFFFFRKKNASISFKRAINIQLILLDMLYLMKLNKALRVKQIHKCLRVLKCFIIKNWVFWISKSKFCHTQNSFYAFNSLYYNYIYFFPFLPLMQSIFRPKWGHTGGRGRGNPSEPSKKRTIIYSYSISTP